MDNHQKQCKVCAVKQCEKPPEVRGWCMPHYRRFKRHGDPRGVRAPWNGDVLGKLRFYGWTETTGALDTPCWEFNGPKTSGGYGKLRVLGVKELVHRLAYRVWVGPIPEGLCVRHDCDNPPCINPAHLRTGTHAENMRDAAVRGRMPSQAGDKSPLAKLTWDKVREIRHELSLGGESQQRIAEKFGVTQSTISKIALNQTWITGDDNGL